ncbi:MAG TPA: peptide ABC transporter ATP-binding protein [Lysinibacillus sp.]|nr:peptide ABC transporter ATP-binding protein [Lysinibacillus sp.]
MTEPKKVIEIKNLDLTFNKGKKGANKAINNVSLDIYEGETFGLVGESGSGKSVTSNALMKLIPQPPGIYESGQILFNGRDLVPLTDKEMSKVRGNEIAMIFQDPMTSLNPTMKVGRQITEVILQHKKVSKADAKKRAIELLTQVGIPFPEKRYNQYPHEFSGGMRQRVVIAIALAADPKLLIADEPTTALDVTIQAQILELMKEIQKNSKTSIIFITHDLGVVANIADRVAVMYAGQIVEYGTVNDIFYNPKHPYTWGLLGSMPDLDNDTDELLRTIPGSPPDLTNPPKGDAFAARNEFAMAIDYEQEPPMFQVSETHFAKTWLLHPDAPKIPLPEAVAKRIEGYLAKEAQEND